MNSQAIYAFARNLTGTDSSNMPDATLLTYLNIAYHDLEKVIVSEVNEDFFYTEWTADLVNGQRLYSIPVEAGSIPACSKVNGISIKRKSTDLEHIKLDERKLSMMEKDMKSYSDDSVYPFFSITDKYIELYPSPTEDITGGLIIYGIQELLDLTSSSAEADVLIPRRYHNLIAYGMAPMILETRRDINGKIDAQNRYAGKLQDMLFELSDRYNSPQEGVLPDTTYLS